MLLVSQQRAKRAPGSVCIVAAHVHSSLGLETDGGGREHNSNKNLFPGTSIADANVNRSARHIEAVGHHELALVIVLGQDFRHAHDPRFEV